MNIKLIDKAIKSYTGELPASDIERLNFFRNLWELQEHHADLAKETVTYEVPPVEKSEQWYWAEKPILLSAPIKVDEDRFVAALEDISVYFIDNAGLKDDASEKLRFFDWRGLVDKSDLEKAGYDPIAYLDSSCELAENMDEEPSIPGEVALLILSFALRPMLQPFAQEVMDSLAKLLKEGNTVHEKPLCCPVCGSKATAAFVGETPSSQGNGRMLYCGTCGTQWEFERIRCASCGTHNQQHLHYFHIEGDDAHRLHNCQECGDYVRTVFQNELKGQFSFEVEDVVMARLDMVANDPRFIEETESK